MTSQTRIYNVPDMTCDHCRSAIEGEVASVADVTSVAVDLDTKTVTVTGGDDTPIRVAIDDAGFDIAD